MNRFLIVIIKVKIVIIITDYLRNNFDIICRIASTNVKDLNIVEKKE